MRVKLVAHTPNPLYVCAEAAAVCYKSEPDLKIVKHCIRSGHHSPLEHSSFTFRIEGISRACSLQLVRHRMASYSQESQRYVNYDGDDINWAIFGISDAAQEIINCCNEAFDHYSELVRHGHKPEDARLVLPNATPTTIYVTMNIRALMNFFNERLCTRAQYEIRKMAVMMKLAILKSADISDEEKEIFKKIFVAKCEKFDVPFCPEVKGCGIHKTLKELTSSES